MKSREYIPAVERLAAIVEAQRKTLSPADLRALNKVKTWLREREENASVLSPHKVNPTSHYRERGIVA